MLRQQGYGGDLVSTVLATFVNHPDIEVNKVELPTDPGPMPLELMRIRVSSPR
jgi:hypothetical protein